MNRHAIYYVGAVVRRCLILRVDTSKRNRRYLIHAPCGCKRWVWAPWFTSADREPRLCLRCEAVGPSPKALIVHLDGEAVVGAAAAAKRLGWSTQAVLGHVRRYGRPRPDLFRAHKPFTLNGVTKSQAAWARHYGVTREAIRKRILKKGTVAP